MRERFAGCPRLNCRISTTKRRFPILRLAHFITDFGDPAIVLPVGGIIGLWLFLVTSWQITARWTVSLLLVGIGAAGLRLLFYIWPPLVSPELRIPSGHTAGSALVYGGFALIIARAGSEREGAAATAMATLIISAIAFSRVYLPNGHSAVEVAVGLIIGLGCLAWFARADFAAAGPSMHLRAMTVAVTALAWLLHGQQFNVWPLLRAAALYVHSVFIAVG